MTKIRTRFAPSPTGRMHVGNLRTALYAYLITKHEGGDFILRIEDTDQERYVEGAVDIIYRTLAKTGLLHDEGPDKDKGFGPYVQSERQAQGIYLKYAQQLVEQGDAYYCFCKKEELEGMKRVVAGKEISIYDKRCLKLSKEEVQRRLDAGEPHVIRFNMPTEGTTTFHDVIYGDITVNNEELEDLILIKSDGYPTYNFANVIDDHLMEITHVVRGNEYLSSAPKYNRIYEAFGWDILKIQICLSTLKCHHSGITVCHLFQNYFINIWFLTVIIRIWYQDNLLTAFITVDHPHSGTHFLTKFSVFIHCTFTGETEWSWIAEFDQQCIAWFCKLKFYSIIIYLCNIFQFG